MDAITTFQKAIAGLVIGFFVLALVFRLLELTRPAERRQKLFRRGFLTDVAYWLFTPLITEGVSRIGLALVAAPIAYVVWQRVDWQQIPYGFGPVSLWPYWVQALGILVIGDFVGYWMHRLFHGRRLWRFHAIHHTSTDLDWLSSVRLHPVNDLLQRMATAFPALALGFAPAALAGVVPVFGLFAILIHANLDWDWGRFRWVIASPRFHRWHHTDETEARDKNFAGLFPLWDIMFGTYYMPKDRMPQTFGTDTPVPDGLWAQMRFPFRGR